MVRKTRSDKKDTICKRCSHECSTPQKLCEHLKRKNPYKPLQKQKEVAFIQMPIQVPIQKTNQQAIQASKIKAQIKSSNVNMSNKEKSHVIIPTLVPELESEKKAPILGIDYITEEEAKNWINPNNQKSKEHYRFWRARLLRRGKELGLGDHDMPENLHECQTLCHDLEQHDPEAVRLPTLKELESEGDTGPKNLINKEFKRLEEIKGHKKSEKDLEFKEQEELGTAVKRRVIVVHHANVLKSYPDNGSDIQKMLES
ncbi:uncharacterized protein OCT59_022871 [Rhizophagus irregularis]|uniref:Uncharacterized protein n=3 Tax=Rhizophagus irregularis TaxID=588596 RepID=A0A015KJM4_RHIIW|nr:hypothetical protein GLOIN_2v1788036 [Rhizophagus irregularis DAOM 181602=DAOM 197198]EXX67764.1 hypothetical protein RirG_111420 [Rhizophagus irregularis DAOM 197198w]POG60331.1 hypothetical protein GLOIN_2v1788036 [Rhizophagus irregularis DAOM 181602=DAOM 197198]UZO29393.1 hypothetical protein OCT59_022871 [Rhizophagus irregularis]GBC35434.1 hypothetical protein GLOIN_2v1788036 [Rhizophagus irregularis DAOM 181602=DAOM 197198]|eukprot:XP_025167197.1 hypothetical protein GLOIN_2v1788036 [Rhizophagus irregularis DAOM 181602=DAOM 197198]